MTYSNILLLLNLAQALSDDSTTVINVKVWYDYGGARLIAPLYL